MIVVSSMLTPPNPNFERTVRDSFAEQALMARLGASLTAVGAGRAEIELPFSAAVSQRQGRFASPAVAAVGECAGACAALTLMPAGSEVTTVEYKINFIRPASGNLLRASGRVMRAGQSLIVARVDVTVFGECGESGCALLQVTLMSVEP
jgi:uncharacterized protein (TIGR00369 family)